MTGNKYKYTITDAPTMAEECYSIIKSRYSKLLLQKQLKSLEIRFEILEDDLIELKREIDDIKKIPSKKKKKAKVIVTQNYNSSDNEEAKLRHPMCYTPNAKPFMT
jgi:hypothetical protein